MISEINKFNVENITEVRLSSWLCDALGETIKRLSFSLELYNEDLKMVESHRQKIQRLEFNIEQLITFRKTADKLNRNIKDYWQRETRYMD